MANLKFAKTKCIQSLFKLYFKLTDDENIENKINGSKKFKRYYFNQLYMHQFYRIKQAQHKSFVDELEKVLTIIAKEKDSTSYDNLNNLCGCVLDAFCEDIHATEVQNNMSNILKTVETFDIKENFYPRCCFAVAFTNSFAHLSEEETLKVQENARKYITQLAAKINDALRRVEYYSSLELEPELEKEIGFENVKMPYYNKGKNHLMCFAELEECEKFLKRVEAELSTLHISLEEFLDTNKMMSICNGNVEKYLSALRGRK